MRLRVEQMITLCANSSCPTVYRTNRGTYAVQGYALAAEDLGVDLPDGELLVEIPPELLRTAAASLG
jgi:hypothetical protein